MQHTLQAPWRALLALMERRSRSGGAMPAYDEDDLRPPSALHGVFSVGHAARAKTDRTIDGLVAMNESGVASDALWATQRRLPGGVTGGGVDGDEGCLGITVSACCLVSLEPPLFLVSLHNES